MPLSEWRRYRLSWRLASPLHIGYRTIGTIARTRLWVPGRNMWGALIDTLARAQGATSQHPQKFQDVQQDIDAAIRFEAWFITPGTPSNAPADAWYPKWQGDGLHYGAIPEREMQRLVLGANVSTAIDHGPTIAEEGMLFETEYIAPLVLHGEQKGQPLWLVGHLWAQSDTLITINDQRMGIDELVTQYLEALSIGGEQKSGYGRMISGTIARDDDERYTLNQAEDLTIRENAPFPLLVATRSATGARGQAEPIVGRTTSNDEKKKPGHGANLETATFCWLPGSVKNQDISLPMNKKTPGIAGM